ncbi:Lrp/AsnC family transcriptional regulator [Moorella sulfitireducens]|uniref:siroheme decarboxylase subunit beta n=1 Tax=Neomoorella sulfitireducens TaxID=2972948 RepID=UPI0021ACA089|nr:Lrp/AsnC family transcriptional regulator [Moorella sulfitireducens]
MPRPLTDLEKELVRQLQGDIPLVSRPFLPVAEKLGISEAEVLEHIRHLRAEGIIRRFGAALRHREAGITANAMVVWQLPPEELKRAGEKLATFPEVTHCYQRRQHPDWPYNLYAVIHCRTREACEKLAARLAAAIGHNNYHLVFSTEELKKESMQYFIYASPECQEKT